jgi:hypothetical protein
MTAEEQRLQELRKLAAAGREQMREHSLARREARATAEEKRSKPTYYSTLTPEQKVARNKRKSEVLRIKRANKPTPLSAAELASIVAHASHAFALDYQYAEAMALEAHKLRAAAHNSEDELS